MYHRKKRCVIYPKDIQLITGRSARHAQDVVAKIKRLLQKRSDQYVTVHEFSDFSGIPLELVMQFIDD
ncbi:hypothetical protein IFO69_15015 [Echinicola sp. CAU 1574]|uniref:Uncharacterized protein n=1 Tax=Echinicola arenosa TaxID=2774144 RepID=A0ABR9AMP0_9BACT|nr:hypothetical protein [Echinicola arenosa]MBD8490066.1 hypothetical protein [Echinicola arenosa]